MTKLHIPIANCNKLSPKFDGPYKVIGIANGNKYRIQHLETGEVINRHVDDLKRTNMTSKSIDETETDPSIINEDLLDDADDTHEYRRKLRSFYKDFTEKKDTNESEKILLVCKVTEILLQDEFDNQVHCLLSELGVDPDPFHR